MKIQINTGHHIDGGTAFVAGVENIVATAFSHIAGHISRVEVHLNDESSGKGGRSDQRCMMEARLEGRPPLAISHHAGTVSEAIDGAVDKLKRRVEETIEQLRDH